MPKAADPTLPDTPDTAEPDEAAAPGPCASSDLGLLQTNHAFEPTGEP